MTIDEYCIGLVFWISRYGLGNLIDVQREVAADEYYLQLVNGDKSPVNQGTQSLSHIPAVIRRLLDRNPNRRLMNADKSPIPVDQGTQSLSLILRFISCDLYVHNMFFDILKLL